MPGKALPPDNENGLTSLRRIVSNIASLLTSNVTNKVTTFILYALVARYLSAFEFGQMSLALTFFFLFQVLALAGLETFITRAVANDKSKTGEYFINGSAVVVVFSLFSMVSQFITIRALNYGEDTAAVILLLSLGLLPFTLSTVCQAIFQAWERMRYIAYANIPVNIAKVVFAFLLLSWGYGLYALIVLLLASLAATTIIQWWLLLRYITQPRLALDLQISFSISKSASTFLGIEIVMAVTSSLNTILLSKLTTETEVGFYGAAAQLMVPLQILYQSIVVSIFPLMCQRFNLDTSSLKRISGYLTELLLVVAVPAAVGLFFLSDFVLQLLYGTDFLPAAQVLRISAWALIPIALAVALGQVLFASHRELITLRITLVNAVVSLALGLILVSQFGLVGAALAGVLTRIVDFAQHYVSVSNLLSGLSLPKIAWKSIVAALGLATYLTLAQNQPPFLLIAMAGAIYLGILLVLMIWSNGGYTRFKSQMAAWTIDRA